MLPGALLLLASLTMTFPDDLPSAGAAILFLGRGDATGIDEALLLDAVTIYTRDLGLTIVRAPERRSAAMPSPSVEEAAALVRARGARLAFWVSTGPDRRSAQLTVLEGRRGATRQVFPHDGPTGPELYRAIALKLRAIATGAEPPSPSTSSSIEAPARTDLDGTTSVPMTGMPSTTAGSSEPVASGGARVALGPSDAAERIASRPPEARAPENALDARSAQGRAGPPYPLFLALDYALSVPSSSAPWRNAGALHGIASVADTAEIDLGIEVAAAETQAQSAGSVSVVDVPARLGARFVRRTRSYLVGVGALAGVHALFARARAAAPDTATESRKVVAGSVGLELVARAPSILGFAPELRLFGELNIPNTRFAVRGARTYETGAAVVGLGLGLALPAR